MAGKKGQFDVVKIMVNNKLQIQAFWYRFECSTCEWNDSI